MSTNNICFHEELKKIITKLSSNTPFICCSAAGHNSNQNDGKVNHENVQNNTDIKVDKTENSYTKIHPSFERTLYHNVHSEGFVGTTNLPLSNSPYVRKSEALGGDSSFKKGHASFWESGDQDKYGSTYGLTTDVGHSSLSTGSHRDEISQKIPCGQVEVTLDKTYNLSQSSSDKFFSASSTPKCPVNRGVLYSRMLSIIQQRQNNLNKQNVIAPPVSCTQCDITGNQYESLTPSGLLATSTCSMTASISNTSRSTPDTASPSPVAYVSREDNGTAVTVPAPLSDPAVMSPLMAREPVAVTPSTIRDPVTVPVMTELLTLLQNFNDRHRICPYKGLLKYHCKPKSLEKPTRTKPRTCMTAARARVFTILKDKRRKSTVSMATLLSDHIHHRNVYLFLRAAVTRTLPTGLLGSAHNRNRLLRNLSKLVSMGKFDKLCLGELMVGLKTTDCLWLKQLSNNNVKLHILAKVVYWIFTGYIFTLLQTYFYITDTTFLRYKMLYYRQPVWQKLHTLALNNLLQKKIMKPISEPGLRQLMSDGALGVSTLRFLPKPLSVRPIVNMGTTAATPDKKLSVNKQLLDIHQILSYIKEQHPSCVGYGQFGTDDIHRAWQQYGQTWRDLGRPALYFVKTDVTDCYNSILQRRLYRTLEAIIETEAEDEYVIRKFVSVMVTRGHLKRSFHRQATPFSAYTPDFTNFARSWIDRHSRHDVIMVDKVVNQHDSKASILEVLKAHLFSNIIKVGTSHYIQTSGISQGSVISTLLCNFYYAEMEQRMFHVGTADLLLRIVDDYLLVTPSRQLAHAFLHQMIQGIPEYNCQTNVKKVLTNFTAPPQMPDIPNIGDEEWFPWCGMCFNTKMLEVGADYTRYQAVGIRDTVTIDMTSRPGTTLKNKLLRCVQPKCHAIFLSGVVNSMEQVCSNCYQLFLLAAFKFHAIVRRLPHQHRVTSNMTYLMGVIHDLGSYVHYQTGRANKGSEAVRCDRSVAEMDRDTIMLLCLRAFHVKLGHHHSMYTELVTWLGRRVLAVAGRLGPGVTARIQTLCGTAMPPGFDQFIN